MELDELARFNPTIYRLAPPWETLKLPLLFGRELTPQLSSSYPWEVQ